MAPTPLSTATAFEHLSLLAARDVSNSTIMNRQGLVIGIGALVGVAVLLVLVAYFYRACKGKRVDNGH